MRWGVPTSPTIPATSSSRVPSTVLVFEICLQPPYVMSVPRRHVCTMYLDHVGLQVHLSVEHDEFLVKTSVLFAWVVFLHEVSFLRHGLNDRSRGSLAKTNQRLVVLEAERQSITTSRVVRNVLTTYARSRFVCRQNILHVSPACARTIRRHQGCIPDRTRTSDEVPCRCLLVAFEVLHEV